jgi:hypothetical protein
VYALDSTASGAERVRRVDRLSTTIASQALVTPILSWTSPILKRSAAQSPLTAYTLLLFNTPTRKYNPFDDLVGTAPGYTNTTLQSLSIMTSFGSTATISLPQISSIFTGLRSLFLVNVPATSEQTITLPHLELLNVHHALSAVSVLPIQTWATPALRHAYFGHINTAAQFHGLLDGFCRRYAAQLESLVLFEHSQSGTPSLMDLPPDFWVAFGALRLLGLRVSTLERDDWTGWAVVPPPAHPLQYVVCWSPFPAEATVDRVRQKWTYHEGVRFVVGQHTKDTYHLVRDIRDGQWIAKMEETNGILPES